jgi:hypothetical protein
MTEKFYSKIAGWGFFQVIFFGIAVTLLTCFPLSLSAKTGTATFQIIIALPQIISTQGAVPENQAANGRGIVAPALPSIVTENIVYVNNEPMLLRTFVNR